MKQPQWKNLPNGVESMMQNFPSARKLIKKQGQQAGSQWLEELAEQNLPSQADTAQAVF